MPNPLIKNQYPGAAPQGDVIAKCRISAAGEFIFNEGGEFQAPIQHDGPGLYEFRVSGDKSNFQFVVSLGPNSVVNADPGWLVNSAYYSTYSYIVHIFRWNPEIPGWELADPPSFDVLLFKQYQNGA